MPGYMENMGACMGAAGVSVLAHGAARGCAAPGVAVACFVLLLRLWCLFVLT